MGGRVDPSVSVGVGIMITLGPAEELNWGPAGV